MEKSPEIVADFEGYQNQITASLKAVTSNAVRISSQDLGFHRSSSEKFSKSLASQNAHLLRLTNKLLKCATKDSGVKPPTIQDVDGLEDSWRKVVDVIDDLLEKADASLDEYNGVIKRLSPAQQDFPSTPPPSGTDGGFHPKHNFNIVKPQLRFDRKVNNYEEGPWKPLLTKKPHAIVPLEECIELHDNQCVAKEREYGMIAYIGSYKHPYAHEIENSRYPDFVYEDKLPIPFTRPENSEPKFVDTKEDVQDMLEELKGAKEIAIDLEHNDKNSYIGLVSLMQISTRSKDWIVDTLKPWREDLQILNEVFTDPNIVKVFHGSTMDMIWLQRDLGLYIVGLFDTYHACVELNFPGRGLAFLLQKYANFYAQKQYQLADWRVRPLPKELLDYARSDTHYLLYIYDNLRNELVRHSANGDNLIDRVHENSKKEALQVYQRFQYDSENGFGPNGWMKLLLPKIYKNLTNEQFGVLRALHEWRDQKARHYDDGESLIMPNNYLWTCAETMPTTRYELFKWRIGKAPRFISEHTDEFLSTIKKGKIEGQQGPSVQEVLDRNAEKLGALRNIKKLREQKPQDVNRSVAATLQRISRSDADNNNIAVDVTETVEGDTIASRTTNSDLWGTMNPVWSDFGPNVVNMAAAAQALKTVLPLQNLTHLPSAIEDLSSGPEPEPTTAMQGVSTTNGVSGILDQSENNIFTLSDRKKRKADEVSLEDGEVGSEEDAGEQTEHLLQTPSQQPSRKMSRSAKKAAKRARKEAEKRERSAAQANLQPFDFANTPSMFDPSAMLNTQHARNQPFNPFAKALDTSTGARRNKMGKEQPGKSHTFKS